MWAVSFNGIYVKDANLLPAFVTSGQFFFTHREMCPLFGSVWELRAHCVCKWIDLIMMVCACVCVYAQVCIAASVWASSHLTVIMECVKAHQLVLPRVTLLERLATWVRLTLSNVMCVFVFQVWGSHVYYYSSQTRGFSQFTTSP